MHIAVVTTEYAPLTGGGAGVLTAELRHVLEEAGHRVSIVVAAPVRDDTVITADGDDDAGWELAFMAVSKAAAEAVARLHADDPVDLVEIQDFDGLAFWLLTHRGDLGFGDVPVTVRFHGPVALQVEAMGRSTPELDAVAVMERESYAMADGVTVPSAAVGRLVEGRFGVEPDRLRVGVPPVRRLADAVHWSEGGSELLVVGRLSEVKGSHDMIDAAVPVLRDHPDVSVAFVGADGWSVTADTTMREFLTARIPDELIDRIRFVDPLEPDELANRMAAARAVVAPSRFESFHLGVREARHIGAPVIVPELPAFADLLDGDHGASGYDGTVADLTRALDEAADPQWAAVVAAQPPCPSGDALGPYRDPLVVPRHRRSQGGRATAAIARLEEAWLAPRRTAPSSLGRRLLERLPTGLYTAGKRLVPNRIKDRLRDTTDLGDEADRRRWEQRFDRGVAAMAGRSDGRPRVTVVIPCYNQGAFIWDALLSVFEQTVGGVDVVVVDDGSDDGVTSPMLADLDLPGVRVLHQDNAGLPAARNAGIAAARAPLVVTLDADDMLAPSYVERLAEALGDDPTIAFAHCWAELVGDVHMIWATRPYNPYQLLLSNSVVGCVMLRTSAWEAVGGYDESMRSGNEDWDLWIRLSAAGFSSVQVREPLFRYRKHGVSMSVETESRYEDALDDRTARLPDVYSHRVLEAHKSEFYPLVTILHADPITGTHDPDIQLVAAGASIEDALDSVRGKYVVWLPPGATVDTEALTRLCEALEADDDAGAASTAGKPPVTVVRAWSLFDPAAPARVIATDLPGRASASLAPGSFPRAAWQVPTEIRGIPVDRQRPEESGVIPEWAIR